MEQTGHRSISGVRSYKRTSDEQEQVVSDILGQSKRCKTNTPPLDTVNSTHVFTFTVHGPSICLSIITPYFPSHASTACTLNLIMPASAVGPSMQQRISTMEVGCHVQSPARALVRLTFLTLLLVHQEIFVIPLSLISQPVKLCIYILLMYSWVMCLLLCVLCRYAEFYVRKIITGFTLHACSMCR